MPDRRLDSETRRAVLKGVAATFGVAGLGTVGGHPEDGSGSPNKGHDHSDPSLHETIGDIEQVGYHSLGGIGSNRTGGSPDNPHYGGVTEFRVKDDLGFVGFLSSRDETPNRSFAILDLSAYTRARDETDLTNVSPFLLGYARDENNATASMDIKVTDDANYAFVSREPVSALFDGPPNNVNDRGESTSVGANSLQAWDVSDPAHPELLDEWSAFGLGPHNAYHHQIGGTDYVFAVGYTRNLNGLHIFEFDRSTGKLVPVNKWDKSGNVRNGNGMTDYGDAHDVTIIDDPITGRPYVYFGMWSSPGMQVLDASNPEDLETVGYFNMDRSHYVQPAPTLINGKRIAIAGQETIGVSNGSSGKLYLVDCDQLDESGDTNPRIGGQEVRDEDGTIVEEAKFLDVWEWAEEISFQNYYLGPHNADITKEGWITLGHYHGGVMYFEITDDFNLAERGSFKGTEPVPQKSMLQEPVVGTDLGRHTPYVWSAVESNGLTFAADINQGIFVSHLHDMDVGSDVPVDIDVDRPDDGHVFDAGGTNHVQIDVDAEVPAGEDVELLIRDRLPPSWDVIAGDDRSVETIEGYRTIVEFNAAISGSGGERSGRRQYFAEAPAEPDSYTFGPVEYSTDGGETWTKVNEAVDTNLVSGVTL